MKRKLILITLCLFTISSLTVFASGANEVSDNTKGIGLKWAANAEWAPADFSSVAEGCIDNNGRIAVVEDESNLPDFL